MQQFSRVVVEAYRIPVQEAVARYYDEDTEAFAPDHLKPRGPRHAKSSTERLLSPEFWRGQMHGGGSKGPIHARHMRPRCSIIPSGKPSSLGTGHPFNMNAT